MLGTVLALVMFCSHFVGVLSRVSACTTGLKRNCQSPEFSDQAHLDIPCVEHAMSNIRFNYLEALTVTWDF